VNSAGIFVSAAAGQKSKITLLLHWLSRLFYASEFITCTPTACIRLDYRCDTSMNLK